MKRFSIFVLTPLLILVSCAMVWAQATAQISGVAKDQSGAVLPGVEITATQTDTGVARMSVTNETGSYVFPNLPIGPYKLEASLPGFRTFVQTGIVLQVNSSPTINVTLEVGQVTEQVQVEANAALVETRNIGVGSVVENTRILELPLNGRQAVELIALAGAAAPAPLVDGSSRDPFAKASFSVAGGLNTGVAFTLDGAFHNNPQSNGYMSTPFPDALQEFKVETSAGAASGGAKSAGSVSLVTKSGTNEFHGDLFEFVRNGKFNARNFFATRRDTIKRNQFGGTIGGPVIKSKLFFFGGYQGTTLRQDPSDLISFVPTAAMFNGDFTAFASAACNNNRAITLRAPFVNNRIDPAQFSKAAIGYAKKLPTTNDPCGKIIYGNPTYENGHMFIARIDYQKSDKHSIFGRYLGEHLFDPAPYDLNHNLLSSAGNSTPRIDGFAQAFTVGSTYLFSANIVNAFRLTGNRIAAGKFEPTDLKQVGLGSADLGIKAFSYTSYFLPVAVTGGGNFTTSHTAGSARDAVFAANDDLSVLRGNHQMSFGANAALWWVNSYTNTYHTRFAFNGATTGLGMADFFIGHASEFNAGPPVPQNKRDKAISVYGADTWKATQRLTVNYGVRWQPYTPMVNRDGGSMNFSLDALKQGIKSQRFDNTPPGMFFTGDPGFPGDAGIFNRWWQFAPRVGLAWDVNGDGKTSIRASAGSSYDFPNTHYMVSLTSGPPWAPKFTLTDVQMDDPWANYPGGDQLPIKNGKDVGRDAAWPLYSATTAVNPHTKNMQVVQWNLAVQRQIGTNWLASVSYLGSETSHMWSLEDLNPAIFLGLGPCTLNGVQYNTCSTTANQEQRRRFILAYPNGGAKYGDVTRIAPEGTSSYNAMLVSIQRRAARGVTVNANYTLSHCISDHPQPEQTAFGTRGNWGWTNGNRRLDRGNCSSSATDRRHVFNVSGVAETPTFSSSALRMVASHWRFSPLVRILSGESIVITTSQDRALNAMRNQRVDQVLGNVYGDGTPGSFLNVNAFAIPALGTIGNMGMGSVKGPGQWQFDMAVSRSFQVREMQRVEFRAEAFNVTNSLHMKNPEVNFNSSLFGKVTTAYDPRIMQFALKYFF